MGLIEGLLGNATETDAQKVQQAYRDVLIPGEQVQAAFTLVRDQFIFTDKRLISVDKQGLTGKKVEYLSIPYKSIKYFSVETAGRFDRDAELKIWVSTKFINPPWLLLACANIADAWSCIICCLAK